MLAGLGVAGCDTTMETRMDRMKSLVDEGRSETARHVAAIEEAPDASAIEVEMGRHADALGPMMGDVDETLDRLARYCYGEGLAGMRAQHGAFDGEVAHHSAIMSTQADPAGARIEVDRHGAAITAIFDGMDTAMARMSCD